MKRTHITPAFIELAPKELEEGVLYISTKYKTALHKCCCGCGEKVVTPLSPAHWQVHVSKGGVTLHPSIGNWGMACKSHYWIRDNRVVWAGAMSQRQINVVRQRDRVDQARHIAKVNHAKAGEENKVGWMRRLLRFLFG